MATTTASASKLRLKFFEYLFGEEQGWVCVAFSDKLKAKFRQAYYEWPRAKQELSTFIDSKAKDHNVWFGVHLLKESERNKINCLPTNLVWADLDNVDPENVDPPPTCIIQSSPSRYQAYWRLKTIIPPDVAEQFAKKVAYHSGADKTGWNLGKLLRVPHTLNFKYDDPPEVTIERILNTKVPMEVFEKLPEPEQELDKSWEVISSDTPEIEQLLDPRTIIHTYKSELHSQNVEDVFLDLFTSEPGEHEDWSARLWRLINICAEVGMDREQTFSIALEAKCNKYKRDNRPVGDLWKEVNKAHINHSRVTLVKESAFTELKMPILVDPDVFEEDSLVKDYKKWGNVATDAPAQYHELACFIALSALTSAGLRLEASFGELNPNIWGLILGESTLTRKTTAMRMAMEIVHDLDEDVILATDGSAEGLLTGLSTRPSRVSMFYKDEVSGFFDSINRKDYLAGMPETLTQLYDVPGTPLRRLLRKEVVTIVKPYFIFFGGGIRDKVFSLIDEEYITSGFMPRFLIVSGENDFERIRPTGPPTGDTFDLKQRVVSRMGELKVAYNLQTAVEVGSGHMMMPARIDAKLTDEAWGYYGDLEMQMIRHASESPFAMVALPTFTRLAFSMLKMAMLITVSRKEPKDNNTIIVEKADIRQAAWYIQKWGSYSVELISNAGKPHVEKLYDKIVKKVRENGTGGTTKSSLMLAFRLNAREANDVIETLRERGQVTMARKGKTTRLYPV